MGTHQSSLIKEPVNQRQKKTLDLQQCSSQKQVKTQMKKKKENG
jgi:hypothetical protein